MNLISLLIFLCSFDMLTPNLNEFEFQSNESDAYSNLEKYLNLANNLNVILGYLNITGNITKISKTCIDSIQNIYYGKIEEIRKIYEGSSKGFVDMSSFYTCIKNETNTFYSIYPQYSDEALQDIARLNNDNLEEHLWIFGVCLRKNICLSSDIGIMFNSVNTLFKKPFTLYSYNDTENNITIDNYEDSKIKYQKFSTAFFNLLPFLPVLIQIIFMIFKIIPVKIFSCCLRRKYLRESDKGSKKQNIDEILNTLSLTNQIDLKIRKCFSLSEILDDLSYSKNNVLFKDEDLTYIRGIKCLGLIFFVFGNSFITLYSYPLCLSEKEKKEAYMRSYFVSFMIISFRLAPALILSSSGFSLAYKFLNFLDKKLLNIYNENPEEYDNNDVDSNITGSNEEKNKEKIDTDKIAEKIEKKNDKITEDSKESSESKEYYENTFGIKFYNEDLTKKTLNKLFKGQKVNDNVLLSRIPPVKIPWTTFFGFVFRQIHKLICMILGFETFKYAIPFVLIVFVQSPLMLYIYHTLFENLGNPGWNYVFVGNFLDLFTTNNGFLFLKLFFIPMSEFNFFIICSIIIFICYKYKLRLDIVTIFLSIIVIIFKIVYIVMDLKDRNPGMFYTDTSYQRFFFNPIFNMDFYLIGMFFGILNYAVQNGITKNESFIKERPFVKLPLYFLKFRDYHKNKNLFHFIMALIIMIFSLIIVPILFSINFESVIKENEPGTLFLIFSLIDIEIFIVSFYFFLLSCYISGRNIFFRIFNAEISSYGQKLSYWITFGTPTVAYLIVYQNEANISLINFMVVIYGFMILFNAFVISLVYILLIELPYKKLIKLYFNISAEINKVFLEDENEEKIPIKMDELNENDILEDINDENAKNKDLNDDEEDIKD